MSKHLIFTVIFSFCSLQNLMAENIQRHMCFGTPGYFHLQGGTKEKACAALCKEDFCIFNPTVNARGWTGLFADFSSNPSNQQFECECKYAL